MPTIPTWDEVFAETPPYHDAVVGPYRIGIYEHNLPGYPLAMVAFFRQDIPGQQGEWVFIGEARFALPPASKPEPG